jgi:hypothetical protein
MLGFSIKADSRPYLNVNFGPLQIREASISLAAEASTGNYWQPARRLYPGESGGRPL